MEQTPENLNLNQHQAKTEISLYNSIVEKIKNADIDKTFEKIEKNNFFLKKEDFELLGNIAYMYGLEFCSQKESYRKNIMDNFILRMNNVDITAEQLRKYHNIILNVSVENLEQIKDELKDLIISKIPMDLIVFNNIKSNINTIIRNSNFPMQFAIEINDLMKTKNNYSYAELLKINKIIYENLNIIGSTFKNLRALYSNTEFNKAINKASDYFELQKFSLVYFDSILSLKEYFENSNKDSGINHYIDFVENPDLLNELTPELSDEILETEKVINEIDETVEIENLPVFNNPEDTDNFIKGVLIEVNDNKSVENENDLFLTFMEISKNSDLVQYVYQYIKENKDKNRTEFEQVFNFPKILFLDKINIYLDNLKENYKKLVEIYVSEINPDIHPRIITYINDLIHSCIIDNAERKSYLFTQLNENQIFTYKQLHQMIGLIEDCNIAGEHVNTYVNLRDYLVNNVNLKTIFESIDDIETLQFEMQFLTGVSEFYNMDVTEVTEVTEESTEDLLLKI